MHTHKRVNDIDNLRVNMGFLLELNTKIDLFPNNAFKNIYNHGDNFKEPLNQWQGIFSPKISSFISLSDI